jgi:hypothetical protein
MKPSAIMQIQLPEKGHGSSVGSHFLFPFFWINCSGEGTKQVCTLSLNS